MFWKSNHGGRTAASQTTVSLQLSRRSEDPQKKNDAKKEKQSHPACITLTRPGDPMCWPPYTAPSRSFSSLYPPPISSARYPGQPLSTSSSTTSTPSTASHGNETPSATTITSAESPSNQGLHTETAAPTSTTTPPEGSDISAGVTTSESSASHVLPDAPATAIPTSTTGQENTKTIMVVNTTGQRTETFITTTNLDGKSTTVPFAPDPTFTGPFATITVDTGNSNDSAATASTNANGAVGRSLNVSAIVGGVLGGLAFIILLVLAIILIRRRRRAKKTAPSSEFLVGRQYPFSGSTHLHFERAGSYTETDALSVFSPDPPRSVEPSPRTFNLAGEKIGFA